MRFLRPYYRRKTFAPGTLENAAFRQRVERQSDGVVDIGIAALSPRESRKFFDANLAFRGIQPTWIEIENRSDQEYFLMAINIDPDYLSPFEAARRCHSLTAPWVNSRIDRFFRSVALPLEVRPNKTTSGFIFTNIDESYKVANVELVSLNGVRQFNFVVNIPGLNIDSARIDFGTIYPPDELVRCEERELPAHLEKLPSTTLGSDQKTPADPLNIVLIGRNQDISAAYMKRGWDETEVTYFASAFKTLRSLLLRSRYRHSPVSPLYALGRRQDIALQKARGTVTLRNHMRYWQTPLRCGEMVVYVGQISRDIGLRLSRRTLITHKIDPEVDEARDYLLQDLVSSQNVHKIGYVKGVGAAPPDQPRFNFTRDPYFTDGMRLVLFFTSRPTAINEIELLDWDTPPPMLEPSAFE